MLKRIEHSTDDLPFGTSIDTILNHYHFSEIQDAYSFFRAYLLRRNGAVDDDMIANYVVNTINVHEPGTPADRFKNDKTFQHIFENLINRINVNSVAKRPTVNFLVGPTGAGKTVFSKSLFTVCLTKFWENGIIPSRIEYSRLPDKLVGKSEIEPDFLKHMRLCQFRDLLIYFFGSGLVDKEKQTAIIADARINNPSISALHAIQAQTNGLKIDANATTLDTSTRALFSEPAREVSDEDKVKWLHHVSKTLRLKFVISFDGFDSTRIEHFLFDERIPLPVAPLVTLLKGLHEKTTEIQPATYHTENHYLLYLRDTTFERLRTQILRGIGGPKRYPIYWIIPPKYGALVENVARYMTRLADADQNQATGLTNDILGAFDETIFAESDMRATEHVSFVFGSNARQMKRHIKQSLHSTLHRASLSGAFDFERLSAGVDPKTVWMELVAQHSVKELPKYRIVEDLFLSDTRQLVPKLQLDPALVTGLLDRGDFDAVIRHIQDRDETTGNFGSLFNYFLWRVLELQKPDGKFLRQPMLLLLIRILQFVVRHPRCNAPEVALFLRNLGYELNEHTFHFALFVLIRTELIKWDGSTDARHIRDIPLYVSVKGVIGINKILFSITYVSESFIGAVQYDRSLTKTLIDRSPDNAIWVVDCISNASIALYVIGEIESIESGYARKYSVDTFDEYCLYNQLVSQLTLEAKAILTTRSHRALARRSENLARLREARREYSGLIILGDDQ